MMDMPLAEKRQIENEMIFRRKNEKVSDGLDEIDAMHIADDNPELITDDNLILQFKCECSDENCEERISIKLGDYKQIHIDRDTFIIKPNHQVDPIEKIIRTESEYSVVKKNNSTKEPGEALNDTSINNT